MRRCTAFRCQVTSAGILSTIFLYAWRLKRASSLGSPRESYSYSMKWYSYSIRLHTDRVRVRKARKCEYNKAGRSVKAGHQRMPGHHLSFLMHKITPSIASILAEANRSQSPTNFVIKTWDCVPMSIDARSQVQRNHQCDTSVEHFC
jgi:hypothetical protein